MIRYTVTWHKVAEDELAEIWLQSPTRSAVTAAVDKIDRELAVDAHLKGTFLVLDIFELLQFPLFVYFRFSQDDRLVTVLLVKTVT